MNSDEFNRLRTLYNSLGINAEEGTDDYAELEAICAGIDLVKEEYDLYFNEIFPDSANAQGLSLYCEMLNIDGKLGIEDKRKLVKDGLSEVFGKYTDGELKRVVNESIGNVNISSTIFLMHFSVSVLNKFHLLPKISRIIQNYLSPCVELIFDGDGFSFDIWDSTPFMFEDYDKLKLSFRMLESLK